MTFELIRDLHKDARGFRPSSEWTAMFNAAKPERQQAIWDMLCEELAASEAQERAAEAAAAARFESLVADAIALGAGDRATALRWILEGEGLSADADWYGMEYAAVHFGLPISYFKEAA